MFHAIGPMADYLVARCLHDRIMDLSFLIMSTAHAELHSAALVEDSAESRCRAVLTALFGEPHQRPFDVRFWDGAVDRGKNPRAPFTLVLNRPAALRRMLFPPNELSIVESYIAGDVDIDGSMEAATMLSWAIGDRLRSPLAVARLVRMALAFPVKVTMIWPLYGFPSTHESSVPATRQCAMLPRSTTTTTSATSSTSCGSTGEWSIRARTFAPPKTHSISRKRRSSI